MPEPQENLVSLIFLAGDLDAQRLAVAWPKVSSWPIAAVDAKVQQAWAEAAGLPAHVACRLGHVLVQQGICRMDGTTAPEALAFVKSTIAGALSKRRKRA